MNSEPSPSPSQAEYVAALQVVARWEERERQVKAVEWAAEVEKGRLARLARFKLPRYLASAWSGLTDIEMSTNYIQPWNDMAGGGGGYTEFSVRLAFADGRSFNFHDSEGWVNAIHMEHQDYEEFGWAPRALDKRQKTTTVSGLWNIARNHPVHIGKHICCPMAAIIFYAYNCTDVAPGMHRKCEIPWDLLDILCRREGLLDE